MHTIGFILTALCIFLFLKKTPPPTSKEIKEYLLLKKEIAQKQPWALHIKPKVQKTYLLIFKLIFISGIIGLCILTPLGIDEGKIMAAGAFFFFTYFSSLYMTYILKIKNNPQIAYFCMLVLLAGPLGTLATINNLIPRGTFTAIVFMLLPMLLICALLFYGEMILFHWSNHRISYFLLLQQKLYSDKNQKHNL